MASEKMITKEMITVVIGGVTYSLLLGDIQAHVDCYFARAIKDVWNNDKQPILIDRDGVLFQHIYVYLYNYRNCLPFVATGSLDVLTAVRREADYYNFPELVALYDKACNEELQRWCKLQSLSELCDSYSTDSACDAPSELSMLVNTEVYPSCHSGTLGVSPYEPSVLAYRTLIVKFIRLQNRTVSAEGQERKKPSIFRIGSSEPYGSLLRHLTDAMPQLLSMECRLENGVIFGYIHDGSTHYDPVRVTNTNRFATVVYILNSAYTGGAITATRNGVSKSITQPGEYLIYSTEYSLDISTVTSGTLLYAQFDVVHEHREQPGYYRATFDPHRSLPCRSAFVKAVHSELNHTNADYSGNRSGVVLCLSTLYPIVAFDPSSPYLETDPDSLQDRDAVLYEYLKDAFEVSLVTVYVQRNCKAYESNACVIAPAPPPTTTSTKMKIFAPFHNFRQSFSIYSEKKVHCVALYTAMYITAK